MVVGEEAVPLLLTPMARLLTALPPTMKVFCVMTVPALAVMLNRTWSRASKVLLAIRSSVTPLGLPLKVATLADMNGTEIEVCERDVVSAHLNREGSQDAGRHVRIPLDGDARLLGFYCAEY